MPNPPSTVPDNRLSETLLRDEIRALHAYHVPDSAGMIKLDAMENPYSLPAELSDEIAAATRELALNRYPDPAARVLTDQLRTSEAIPASAEILLGNGSDELIQMIAMALARPGAVLLAPEPSFVMYSMIATFTAMRYIGVPLTETFDLDVERMLAAIEAHRPAVIFLAYPNNPTGNLFSPESVRAILDAAPGLVVLDEAYHPFAQHTFMAELECRPNLLVMRTLSKMGLAGLRLGYLAGAAHWLGAFDKVRLPYNINVFTQMAASIVLRHSEVLEAQAEAIRAERSRLTAALNGMPSVKTYPSQANFILLRVADAPATHEKLRAGGVLVKNLHRAHASLDHCLRVTVGTPQENDRFLAVFSSAIA